MHFDLEEISRQLAGIGAPSSFATQTTFPADDLHLEIKGVGRIRLPVSTAAARSARVLATRLEGPARAADDWSIGTALRCSCKLCATLSRFLRAPGESRFEWPLAKERRKHVHRVIDSRDLPLLPKTRRTGRPFTLVLEKTAAVFERDAAERRLWAAEHAWLDKTADAFGSKFVSKR